MPIQVKMQMLSTFIRRKHKLSKMYKTFLVNGLQMTTGEAWLKKYFIFNFLLLLTNISILSYFVLFSTLKN